MLLCFVPGQHSLFGRHTYLHIYLYCSNPRVLFTDFKCTVHIDVEETDKVFMQDHETILHIYYLSQFFCLYKVLLKYCTWHKKLNFFLGILWLINRGSHGELRGQTQIICVVAADNPHGMRMYKWQKTLSTYEKYLQTCINVEKD